MTTPDLILPKKLTELAPKRFLPAGVGMSSFILRIARKCAGVPRILFTIQTYLFKCLPRARDGAPFELAASGNDSALEALLARAEVVR